MVYWTTLMQIALMGIAHNRLAVVGGALFLILAGYMCDGIVFTLVLLI